MVIQSQYSNEYVKHLTFKKYKIMRGFIIGFIMGLIAFALELKGLNWWLFVIIGDLIGVTIVSYIEENN